MLRSLAQSIKQALRATDFGLGASRVTVSIGCCLVQETPSPPVETLLVIADGALYESKRNGRDHVTYVTARPTR